jgi:4-hydroxy-2-oxoglutarate aldolase
MLSRACLRANLEVSSAIAKRRISTRFRGVYAPIPTPFKANEDLDLEGLKSNVADRYSKMNLKGLVVCGSNGEFPLLTFDEKVKVFEAVKKSEKSGKQLFAGTGTTSLKETVELTKIAKNLGYSAAMVVTPYYYNSMMNDAVLIEYYRRLATLVDFPIIIYNIPQFSGTNISVAAVKTLASEKNIVGVKESGPIMQSIKYAMATKGEKDFAVLAGSGSMLLAGLMGGVDGAIISLGNLRANEAAKIFDLHEKGDISEANRIQQGLVELNEAITAQYGVPALKEILGQMGFAAGPCRSPLLPLNDSQKKDIGRMINGHNLLK